MTAAAISLLSAVPVQAASAVSQNIPDFSQEEMETVSYIIDFLDHNGDFLDSKVCAYGEKLENIPIPVREEDEQYIYQFAGWEPEIQEIVTDCALYTAVYERKAKSVSDGNKGRGQDCDQNGFERETGEQSRFSPKVLSNGTDPERPSQVSAISYDVISFQIGIREEDSQLPAEEKEISPAPMPTVTEKPVQEGPVPVNSVPETESAEKSDRSNRTQIHFTKTENIAQEPGIPDVPGVQEIDSQNILEQKGQSADIRTETVFNEGKIPGESVIQKEKGSLEIPVKVEKDPAPSLEKSGQMSGTRVPFFLWSGIFACCMGSINLLKKYIL